MPIAVGQPAPDFTLKDQDQNDISLSKLIGNRNIVLMFYPLDFSPICSDEHLCFVNAFKQFETLDAQLLGISVDSVWTHKAFAEKMKIAYPLLADFHPKGAVAEKFGMYNSERGVSARSIIIIDKSGKVAWAKVYDYPNSPDPKEIAAALASVK